MGELAKSRNLGTIALAAVLTAGAAANEVKAAIGPAGYDGIGGDPASTSGLRGKNFGRAPVSGTFVVSMLEAVAPFDMRVVGFRQIVSSSTAGFIESGGMNNTFNLFLPDVTENLETKLRASPFVGNLYSESSVDYSLVQSGPVGQTNQNNPNFLIQSMLAQSTFIAAGTKFGISFFDDQPGTGGLTSQTSYGSFDLSNNGFALADDGSYQSLGVFNNAPRDDLAFTLLAEEVVPEPTSLTGLAFAGSAALSRRRRS